MRCVCLRGQIHPGAIDRAGTRVLAVAFGCLVGRRRDNLLDYEAFGICAKWLLLGDIWWIFSACFFSEKEPNFYSPSFSHFVKSQVNLSLPCDGSTQPEEGARSELGIMDLETRSCSISQDVLKLIEIFLPQLPEF